MGLMDAFTADAKVEFKAGELYDILRVAANNEKTAKFLTNAVECEVPYNYIREMITGKKEEPKENTFRIEIPRDILDAAFEEAKKEAEKVAAGLNLATQSVNVTIDAEINGEPNPDEGLKDCAPENVTCEECPKKDFCDAIAEDIAGMAEETGEEREGGDE